LCEEFGITLDPRAKVESLPFGQRQVVELLKALNRRARVLILDEPTASLTAGEQEALFETVRKLAGRGRGVIFISHRLREVLGLTDRIEVLRNGRNAGTATTSEADIPTLVRMMVGSREVSERQRILAHPQPSASTETLLHVTGLSTRHKLRDCSFDVRKGEVLGLTGLLGAGRSTLLRCLFGLQKISDGQMRLTGEPYRPRDPQDAIRRGVVLVPEDRGTQGIFPGLSVQDNLTSACWEKISAWPALGGWTPERRRWTRRLAQQQFDELRVKAQNLKQALGELSGGTQQKVVLAKWILRQPHLLLCDEPTAGVDVGTKDEIWRILRDLADRGMSVLYSSSDLEELSVVSDRVLVMADGTVAAEITDPDELRDDERLRTSVQRVAAHVRQGAGGAGPTTWRSAS
jgi:ribose transport system ATP-binding protein